MSDPFADYAKKALTATPERLVGVTKTRSAARVRYSEIVAELGGCEDADMLEAYLASIAHDIAQFQAEIQFYWEGEDDFLGLEREIQAAKQRVEYQAGDDRLAYL